MPEDWSSHHSCPNIVRLPRSGRDLRRRVLVGALVTLAAAGIELSGSWLGNSLFLVADSVHLIAHMGVYGALLLPSRWLMQGREVKTIGVLLVLLGIAGGIIFASVRELVQGPELVRPAAYLLSLFGLGANLATAALLKQPARSRLAFRAAFLHELSDGGLTVVALLGAVVMAFKGWSILDPILSLAVGSWLFGWAALSVFRIANPRRLPPQRAPSDP